MCAEACLVLRLEGPLQAWGTASQFNRRETDLLPSRSAVMGIICAALGLLRGSQEEQEFLAQCASLRFKAIAVPRMRHNKEMPVRRLEDYHTVMDTPKADGGRKDCHITRRQYLMDAAFCALLVGDRTLLTRAAKALQDPVWGLWLGRKCCIPSAPVFAGLFNTEEEAFHTCLPRPLAELIWTEDAPPESEGEDSVSDMPLSFASSSRQFSLRRIRRHQGAARHAP